MKTDKNEKEDANNSYITSHKILRKFQKESMNDFTFLNQLHVISDAKNT